MTLNEQKHRTDSHAFDPVIEVALIKNPAFDTVLKSSLLQVIVVLSYCSCQVLQKSMSHYHLHAIIADAIVICDLKFHRVQPVILYEILLKNQTLYKHAAETIELFMCRQPNLTHLSLA